MRNHDASLIWQIGAIMMGAAALVEAMSYPGIWFLDILALGAIAGWIWTTRRAHPFMRLCEIRAEEIEQRLAPMELFRLRRQLFEDRFLRRDDYRLRLTRPRHVSRLYIIAGVFMALIILKPALIRFFELLISSFV
jgi:hypothetical protein